MPNYDSITAEAAAQLSRHFGAAGQIHILAAPGRVNLIGEHIDYHGLPVLPMALRRSIRVAVRARTDRLIRAASSERYGIREFAWTPCLVPAAAGDWENYLRAAAEAVGRKWGVLHGVDAAIVSDLPPAAGLSSSSALIVAFTLALLRANRIPATFEELMEVLPEGEHFVGTRGGGMDHAASLASRAGCASLISFVPLSVRAIAIPPGWAFLVAHSLHTAEKSGALRAEYNARRTAGTAALKSLNFVSYAEAIQGRTFRDLEAMTHDNAFLHVAGEALRVQEAVAAMERDDALTFGRLLLESHASLCDRLHVSSPPLDRLVTAAMDSGALGARLTGAGFGGCIVALCRRPERPTVRAGLLARFYAGKPEWNPDRHLIDAEPGPGVLYPET